MTVTTHVYTATLKGETDHPLSVRGGRIRLDAGAAPHVSGSLDIAVPDAATLAELDPRLGPRIVVQADAVTPSGTQSRTFDLGLRDRDVRHRDGVVSLQLASDEALLTDYAPLADDTTPLNHQASLRALLDYVLGKVVPGVTLAPSADVAVPALADSQNVIRNPRVGVNVTDWAATWVTGGLTLTRQGAGGPANIPTYMAVQATGGATTGGYVYLAETAISITPGKLYELSVDVGANGAQTLSLDAIMYDGANNIVAFATPATVTPAGAWKRVSTTFYALANASKVRPRVLINGTFAAASYVNVTGWRLSESTGDHDRDVQYFDGDYTDTAQYDYGWAQTVHASISTRKTRIDAATPDALTWKAGQTALEFVAPLVQRFGLRLVCDEARMWTLRAEGFTAPGALSIRHGVNLVDGSDSIGRDAGVWFDAAVTEYVWTDAAGFQHRRVDSYALRTPYSRLQKFQKDTPYAGPGFSQYAVRRAQGRGREVSASVVSDWTARAEQPVTIVLQGAPTQIGQTIAVEFDLDRDELTVRTRTTDTPAGAIDLLTGTIDALTGIIDSL